MYKALHLLALLLVITSTTTSYALDLPDVKAGFWSSKSTTDGETVSTKLCLDRNTMEGLFKNSISIMGSQCAEIKTKKIGDRYHYTSSCKLMGSQISSKVEIKGDFSSRYSSIINSTMTPAFMGKSASSTVQENTYLGKCPAGVEPGDIIMADGSKINVSNMLKQMPNLGELMNGMEQMGIDQEKLGDMLKQMQVGQ